MPLTPTTLAALRTDAGTALLADVAARGVADDRVLATTTAVRAAGHSPELVAAAVETVRLRSRAAAKFGADAERMFFTPAGVEQATRTSVAEHRAARFAAAGTTRLADLCAGIGGDLVAFARAGMAVEGVDADPLTAAVAAANAEALGLADRVTVRTADVTTVDLRGVPAVFCDPARRAGGRRVFDPAAYSPPWDFLLGLARTVPRAAFKVAPGIDHALVPAGAEAEWISDGGDVKEAALWCGDLAGVPRRATLLPSGATLTGTGDALAPVGTVGDWLYDPDGAVVRAHLVAELAETLDATTVDPTIAYLTSTTLVRTPFARAYRVDEVMPFSLKRLRATLRARGVGRVEIKKRGSALDVEQLRRDLRLSGDAGATVVLTRVVGKPTVLLCTPVR
ncbi:MAG: methylase [Mycobacterium sp.]|nr:methylase [Mycobacterium sp.]